jgi:hypothetical protein
MEQPWNTELIEVVAVRPEYFEKNCQNTHHECDEMVEADVLRLALRAAP